MRSRGPAALRMALQEEGGQEKERKGAGRVLQQYVRWSEEWWRRDRWWVLKMYESAVAARPTLGAGRQAGTLRPSGGRGPKSQVEL